MTLFDRAPVEEDPSGFLTLEECWVCQWGGHSCQGCGYKVPHGWYGCISCVGGRELGDDSEIDLWIAQNNCDHRLIAMNGGVVCSRCDYWVKPECDHEWKLRRDKSEVKMAYCPKCHAERPAEFP